MRRTAIVVALAATLVVSLSGTAQASPILGSLWAVPEAVSQNAIPANVPGTAPDVTFEVNAPLNFNASGATVNAWLLSGGAFNIVGSAAALSRLMDTGAQGTIVQFLGTVTVATGQMFTVTHDDGLTLIIGGLNLGFNPGPTAPVVSTATYTGPSGNFAFQLVYGECCGGPAVLQVDLPFQPQAVPEPTTFVLLGSGLAIAGLRRRFRRVQ
jgi:PEP-CTERM motif